MFFSNLTAWDEQLSAWIVASRTPLGDAFFRLLTRFGDGSGIFLILLFFTFFLWRKRKRLTVVLWPLLSVCSSWIFLFLIKNLVQRSRPETGHLVAAAGYSFPSMHAALSVLFYGWLAFLLLSQGLVRAKRKKLVWLGAWGMAFLIGLSRMYLNVHFCTDVLAGWVFGSILLFISLRLYRDTQP